MEFNLSTYQKLKVEYNNAVKDEKEIFIFNGHELLTSYAKYLIEYLKTIFEK